MIAPLAAKALVAMVEKLVTTTFFSRVMIYALEAWSKQTETKLDDMVTTAAADALGVPITRLESPHDEV